jgi:DNA-binding transcriptional MerR regulator
MISMTTRDIASEQDWIHLLLEAKDIGVSIEEVRRFLQSYTFIQQNNPDWS